MAHVKQLRIDFLPIQLDEWNIMVKRTEHFNLLQSWEYGEAKKDAEGWTPVRCLIQCEDKPIGLVQVLTKRSPLFTGLARINRGPLLFSGTDYCSTVDILESILQALRDVWVKKRRSILSILPETEHSSGTDNILRRLGFVSVATDTSWASSIVDLSETEEYLRRSLKSKWRNLLKKAERMDLELETGCSSGEVAYFLEKHRDFQEDKGFRGIGEAIILNLAGQSTTSSIIQILSACKEGRRVSGILVVCHGDSCTYLMGWNSLQGRQFNANYFLLWKAFALLKGLGYRWFDLGGMNDKKAPSIAHFKRGLGGHEYATLGEYLCTPSRLATLAIAKLQPLLSRR